MITKDKNLERAYAALSIASENPELSIHGALTNIVEVTDELADVLLSLGYTESELEELPEKYEDWDT